MKVAVCMFYDDAIKNYGDITAAINKAYCDKHGLTFIVSHETTYTDRHAAYEKVPLLLKHIESYDYVLWIDADAFFYLNMPSIVDLIETYPNKEFIFSQDIPPNHHNMINTGVFIVKNSPYSIEVLKTWAYNEELYKTNPVPELWEQGILDDMNHRNILDIQNRSAFCHYGLLQHFFEHESNIFSSQPFIFHMTKKNRVNRELTAKQYLAEYHL
jgi:hypothetical protein